MRRSMVISLIGRPNVGKSTIFNRLMKRAHKAITFDRPGVTRDRHYGIATFDILSKEESVDAVLVDTGGFYVDAINIKEGQKKGEIEANTFFNIMTDHARIAIDESDLVLMIVDIREGLLPFDEGVAKYIRSKNKPFMVIANKYDHDGLAGEESQFYKLGINDDELLTVSGEHAIGLDDLRRRLQERVVAFNNSEINQNTLSKGVTPREEVVARLSIIGAPNAGKSTLLNKLVGEERALVSNIAGTTVDPIEAFFDLFFGKEIVEIKESVTRKSNRLLIEQYQEFRRNNQHYLESYEIEEEGGVIESEEEESIESQSDESSEVTVDEIYERVFGSEENISETEENPTTPEEKIGSLWRSVHIVDTAGIRKKSDISDFVEEQSVYRALRSITESDIVILMIDAEKGISHQDRRLADIALEKGKSIIVCLNKIDLIRSKLKTTKERKEWLLDLRAYIPWLDFCDIIPISAKYGEALGKLKRSIKKTILIRHRDIPTGELNRTLRDLVSQNQIIPRGSRGKVLKVKYAAYIKSSPPTFLLFTNKSKDIPDNYKRYLQNNLRRQFGLINSPIHIIFRTGTDLENRLKKIE